MEPKHREWLLEAEGMNQYHPTGNARAFGIKARTEALIDYLRTATAASGPLTQGAAAHAIQAYETGAFWAVKALNEADAVAGDDGGGDRVEAEERDGQSDL